jgi:ABC-type sugar transport system permease subunit
MKPKSKSLFENTYVLALSALLFVFVGYATFQDVLFYFTKVEAEGRILKIVNERTGTKPYKITISYFNHFEDHGEVAVVGVDKDFARALYRDKVEPISYGKLYADSVYFKAYKSPKLFTIVLETAGLLALAVMLYLSVSAFKKAGMANDDIN